MDQPVDGSRDELEISAVSSTALSRIQVRKDVYFGNALHLGDLTGVKEAPKLEKGSIDLVVTSPPYWKKRDYRIPGQLGQENSPQEYAEKIVEGLKSWYIYLGNHGSVFLNIGDTYQNKSLQGVPSLIEAEARKQNFRIRNRIVWVKQGGRPEPAKDRLANRHEYIIHFIKEDYYYDLFGYASIYSPGKRGANPGDVWEVTQSRNMKEHLAPFPPELVERVIRLACPEVVCTACGQPAERLVERSLKELDLDRPQARRALELFEQHQLTEEHIAAIRATGISDAGKALSIQTGTGRNTEEVKKLAREAKDALGGYFREFTFAKRQHIGWKKCGCKKAFRRGVILDPFVGSGTTLDVANKLGRSAIGIDLDPEMAKMAAS